jgi:endonuclease-3 related protein
MKNKILHIYTTLYRAFGPQHWWPADAPFEVIIGAILTQSTAWSNVEKAIDNLKAAGALDPQSIYLIPIEGLAKLIRPSGYYNAKALKIKAFADRLCTKYDGDLNELFTLDTESGFDKVVCITGCLGPRRDDSGRGPSTRTNSTCSSRRSASSRTPS